MTRTITPSTTAHDGMPGLADTAVPIEPSPGLGATPRRRRSSFPAPERGASAPGAADRPAVCWAGADGVLRELVRDHATAVGLDLVDGSGDGSTVCTVTDTDHLTARGRSFGRGGAPLLVVTEAPDIPAAVWSAALTAGARAVLPLPGRSDELLSRLAELARPRSTATLLGVVGGCGGAGASSFAARLAAAARAQGPITLVDADPLGGGADLLVEAPALEGIRWREAAALGSDDGEALHAGLPGVDEVRLLVAGEDPGPTEQTLPPVLSALSVLGGTVVVDLSPALVPAAAEHLHQLLVVVPATDHAVRAAARRLRAWQLPSGLARAVVRRSGPLGAGEVCEDLALPLATSFRDCPRGTVPLLDVRRRGADRAARELMVSLDGGGRA
ncbi:hypothetical protein CFK39_05445 [Brachybacterium avium]|uniref:Septum formation initiator n=1 Tax=Brachybacterium avium TaxID=2017485 RepID=A0A220UBD8_9MICO|nr:hypothetical protein [Brachybacterium avium]ASK65365.1 hypothetical protein CFK39_05445 [Brachybacterium avium]